MTDWAAWIAGEPFDGAEWDEVRNPYDGSVIGRVPRCNVAQVELACRAAKEALQRKDFPQWRRAEVLESAARDIQNRAGEFATLIVAEAGKPLRDARSEVTRCIDTFRFSAAVARTLSGEMVALEASQAGEGRLGFALRVPIGVVAAITPFNFPLNLVAHKLAPSIAAGCPVVLKPADKTPLSSLLLAQVLVAAGLPDDWLSVVTGDGPSVGTPLVTHKIPAVISFTGSVPVGRAISAQAPDKKVLLELGSNAPVIVASDADLERAVARISVGGFSYAGQSCISTQRVLVHSSLHSELVSRLSAAVSALVVGDPAKEETEVGPLIREREYGRVLSWIDAAVAGGGKVTVGGTMRDGLLLPTVVDMPPWGSQLVQGEVFGPVVTVTPFETLDEGIALANDSDFGLQVGVFTQDLSSAMQAFRELEFGGVLINEVPTFRADQQPYGGLRDSGNTREGPAYSVHELTELRYIMLTP